jgi:hypothetical protein
MMPSNKPTEKSGTTSESRFVSSPEFREEMIEELKGAHRDGAVDLAEGNEIRPAEEARENRGPHPETPKAPRIPNPHPPEPKRPEPKKPR